MFWEFGFRLGATFDEMFCWSSISVVKKMSTKCAQDPYLSHVFVGQHQEQKFFGDSRRRMRLLDIAEPECFLRSFLASMFTSCQIGEVLSFHSPVNQAGVALSFILGKARSRSRNNVCCGWMGWPTTGRDGVLFRWKKTTHAEGAKKQHTCKKNASLCMWVDCSCVISRHNVFCCLRLMVLTILLVCFLRLLGIYAQCFKLLGRIHHVWVQ
eukprot:Trichotokara_eunicae@DN3861_c0_g1_i2.p1